MKRKNPINGIFNLALFFYLLFSIAVDNIFEPETGARVPWDSVVDKNPLMGSVGLVLFFVILIGCGTIIIEQFWNRFVADVLNVRVIVFQEALSIILLLFLFTA